MKLRGIDLGNVFCASGARGFSGEGYWFHHAPGIGYRGTTLVTKTTTLYSRRGNMRLTADHCPADALPDCIVVKPFHGAALNAVGLSGPGIEALLPHWSSLPRADPLVVSLMSVATSPELRAQEVEEMCRRCLEPLSRTHPNLAVQINLSCPNVGLDPSHLLEEATLTIAKAAAQLPDCPILLKLNALVPPDAAAKIASHPACDAIVCSNTIPWGTLPEKIDWRGIFGSDTSPLARYGGGGLSGAPLLSVVEEWVRGFRAACIDAGLKAALVACGGILSGDCAMRLLDAGADAIELGSVSFLRPWRVQKIADLVNERLNIADHLNKTMRRAT
jgi:dihydroorotate dehydrogenase